MFEALSTIFLIGSDLARSRRFYTETLGLEEASAAADHIRYRIGDVSLVIHAPISDDEMKSWRLEPLREPRGSGVIITLEPKDVDEAYTALEKKGADLLFAPKNTSWGVRMFIVRDPDGFLIEVGKPA